MFVGDPSAGFVEEYRAKFGLDKPLWQQYVNYWIDVSQLNFGLSVVDYPVEVTRVIRVALPWTLGLLSIATMIGFFIGTLLGALMVAGARTLETALGLVDSYCDDRSFRFRTSCLESC